MTRTAAEYGFVDSYGAQPSPGVYVTNVEYVYDSTVADGPVSAGTIDTIDYEVTEIGTDVVMQEGSISFTFENDCPPPAP